MTTISDKRLAELAARSENQIDYSEIPELDETFWKSAELVYPDTRKRQITLRLDPDLVDWFQSQGRGYQTRMNAVLRTYYEAVRAPAPAKKNRKAS